VAGADLLESILRTILVQSSFHAYTLDNYENLASALQQSIDLHPACGKRSVFPALP
jgi:hypothetical protein